MLHLFKNNSQRATYKPSHYEHEGLWKISSAYGCITLCGEGLPDIRIFGCKSRNLQSEHAGIFETDEVSQNGEQSQRIHFRKRHLAILLRLKSDCLGFIDMKGMGIRGCYVKLMLLNYIIY